jgi:hypothetical protein
MGRCGSPKRQSQRPVYDPLLRALIMTAAPRWKRLHREAPNKLDARPSHARKLPERVASARRIADLGKGLDEPGVNRDSARAFM